jgi:hypothetical protein
MILESSWSSALTNSLSKLRRVALPWRLKEEAAGAGGRKMIN